LDIVPRGGGSNLRGSCVPNNSIILDLSKMDKILDIDVERKTADVEAGVILEDLNSELEKFNLEFPVDTLSKEICTIGGMIATNAAGSREIKYGRMRNWVEELDAIDGKGNFRKVSKNDVSDFSGMEGLTGVIIRAKLKLIEKPKRTSSIVQSDSIEEIIKIIKKLKLERDVSIIDILDRRVSSLLGWKYRYHLIVEFESERGKIKGEEYCKINEFRERIYFQLASKEYYVLEDARFFIDKIEDFIVYLEEEDIPFFGGMGIGVLHPCFKANDKKRIEMLNLVRKLRGKISGKFGIGIQKKEFLDDIEVELVKRIKLRYDPGLKLNKGKIVDLSKEDIKTKKEIEKVQEDEEEIGFVGKAEESLIEISETEETQEEGLNGKTPQKEIEEFLDEVIKKEIDYMLESVKLEKEKREEEKEEVKIVEEVKPHLEISKHEEEEDSGRERVENFDKLLKQQQAGRLNLKRPATSAEEKALIDRILGNTLKSKSKESENDS